LRGLLLREGRGGKRGGDEREGKEKGGRRRGREERGGRRKEGEEAFLVMWPRRLSALNPPLRVPVLYHVPEVKFRSLHAAL